MSNDYLYKIIGIGKVRIVTFNGKWWVLKNWRHIPNLKGNLISVSQLDNEGHMIEFGNKTWKVSKGFTIVARGDLVGSLYMLANASNNVVDLASIARNVNKGNHKFKMKGQVGLNKLGKGVSNGNTKKVWVPKMQQKSKKEWELEEYKSPTCMDGSHDARVSKAKEVLGDVPIPVGLMN